jgi:alkylhydroperoxidase family enzyme
MPRIQPTSPPFAPDVEAQLSKMMPPGAPPILLFRTFVKNIEMAAAMGSWGGYELSKRLSLSLRDREILIDRTCARCNCEYEWGVHVAFFAARANLTRDQVASLVDGSADDPCWDAPRDRALIRAADALHEVATISDGLWDELQLHLSEVQLLDLTMLCGWYHAISFTANGASVDLELDAPRFGDFRN